MGRKLLSWGIVLFSSVCVAAAEPATQPAAGAASPQAVNPVLLVLPVAPPADGNYQWVGRGIQHDLVADMTQMTGARVISPASAPAVSDEQAALDQGRQAGAGFVMYGEAQVSGGQLRVTGQLLDVSSARPLAALKATAPVDNLFPLEDSLAVQAAHALPAPIGLPRTAQQTPAQQTPDQYSPYASTPPAATPPAAPATAPPAPAADASPYYSYTESVPPVYYTYNTYAYPYYAWGYPYYSAWPWYGGVGIWYGGGWYSHYGYGGGYYGHPFYGRSFYGRAAPYGGGFHGGAIRGGGGFHGGGGGRGR